MAGRPLKFKSVEELQQKIDEYFTKMEAEHKPYTISGLAVYLETSRETLMNYEEREEFFDTIKGAKDKVLAYVEENAFVGKLNPTFSIFNLKNNFGYKDKTEQEISGPNGGPIETKTNHDLSKLSVEELKQLEAILSRSADS